jgi:hypothetical protein
MVSLLFAEPVLQRRRRHQVVRVVAVQAGDVALGQLADQIGILARRFFHASPARVAAEIDQRRADDDADAAALRVHAAHGVVDARLVRGGRPTVFIASGSHDSARLDVWGNWVPVK